MTHSLNFLLPLSIEEVGYISTCAIRLAQGVVEVNMRHYKSLTFTVLH